MRHAVRSTLLTTLLCLTATGAWAQAYRCMNGSATYFSDKPCGATSSAKLGAIGPVPTRPAQYQAYTPQMQMAPEHLKHLSGKCASLNDAIRTGPTRGLGQAPMNDLRAEYEQKCREDDMEARQALAQEKQQQRGQRAAERSAADRERATARVQSDQCDAMRDVVQLKRKRIASLSETEVAALRQLEASFNGRCLNR